MPYNMQHTLAAIDLLKRLIATPSFSKEEAGTANIVSEFLAGHGVAVQQTKNNVWAIHPHFDPAKPSILLNSHHDTVKPNSQYQRNPFEPAVEDGKLFGLGSNDAGGCLVSLIATFIHFLSIPHPNYNLVLAATAEEEISGHNGIEYLLQDDHFISATHGAFQSTSNGSFAIVGEPTLLEMAVAERGLMVIDAVTHGKAGHAARNEGENALYKAFDDIQLLRNWRFEKTSPLLGDCRFSVTVMNTSNQQHNVVPARAEFVIDVRVNELYTFEELLSDMRNRLTSELTPRSTRLRSTSIPLDHPVVQAGVELGIGYYGSPTTSDKALMPFPSLKMGPGDSARSHSADEFIFVQEIEDGIATYIALLEPLLFSTQNPKS